MPGKIRFGIIGVGNMGHSHARRLAAGEARGATVSAICDIDPERLDALADLRLEAFENYTDMLDSGLCDAVIVATPHYWHAPQTIAAARRGIHVLCEKPIAVTVKDARLMVDECKKARVKFAVMFMQRCRPYTKKMLQIVRSGRLGEIFRVSMIGSSWYRTQAYYDSGTWRGTWLGEGGGILMNQAPHSLDQYQEVAGLPKRVIAHLDTREHKIEVENTANAVLDYGHGKVGYIYATTAEAPGKEELIVSGTKATLVACNGTLKLGKLKTPIDKHLKTSRELFAGPACEWTDVPFSGADPSHMGNVANFVKVIRGQAEPIADAQDGVNEVELCNAIYLAGFTGKPVDLPLDDQAVERLVTKLAKDRGRKGAEDLRTPSRRELRKVMGKQ